jgi:hypothetical protein
MLKYRRRHETQLQKSQTQIMQTTNRNGYEAFHDSNENIETEKWRAFVKMNTS